MPEPGLDAFERAQRHVLAVLKDACNSGGVDGRGGVPTSIIACGWNVEGPPLRMVLEHLWKKGDVEVTSSWIFSRTEYLGPNDRGPISPWSREVFDRLDVDASPTKAHWWRLSSKAMDKILSEESSTAKRERSWEMEALLLIKKDPSISGVALASAVGISESRISRSEVIRRAKKAALGKRPEGFRIVDKDGLGSVDGIDTDEKGKAELRGEQARRRPR